MTDRFYSWHGKGAPDGTPATNALLGAGGDNPLTIGGNSGWVFEEDNRSPDGPADGQGLRRTADGSISYVRAEWEAVGLWEGIRVWLKILSPPTAHWNMIRLTGPGDVPNLINLHLRTSGRARLSQGSTSISASDSPVLDPGEYCFVVQANYDDQLARYRIYDSDGDDVGTPWTGSVAHSERVQGARVGEPSISAHGIPVIDIGSRVSWGSSDGIWIPGDVDPFVAEPDPPPATTAVSHYNTLEGLGVGVLVPFGSGEGPEGTRFHSRLGTGGSVTVSGTGIHGSRSARIQAGNGNAAYVQWGVNSLAAASRVYLQTDEGPDYTTQVAILRNELEEPIARLALSESNRVLMQVQVDGSATTATLPGVVDYETGPIRLELFADVNTNVVKGAWGYMGGPREGVGTIDTRNLKGVPIVLVQFGKMHGSPWAADFLMDDFAANVRATDFIGSYADEYELLTTVGPDEPFDEPGTTFTLSGTGTATFTQIPTPGMPEVPIVQDGTTATGVRPFVLHDGQLAFDYGGAIQRVGVLRAEMRRKTADGWVPVEVRRKKA